MASCDTVLTIQNKKGLHARAAAKFVKTAGQFNADIRVIRLVGETKNDIPIDPDWNVSARSILGLMMLGAEPGCNLRIEATGDDAAAAIEAISALVNARFDEEE